MNVGNAMTPDVPVRARVRKVLRHAAALGVGTMMLGAAALAQPELQHFSIGAQPLPAALDAYSVATGLDIFYDGAVTAGRHSSPIEGDLTPDAALRNLLAGTGLIARVTGSNSVTVAVPVRPHAASPAERTYFTAVQRKVAQVLCARPETRPGDTDLLIQLWIAPSGTVQRAQLLDAPASGTQESAFATVLRGHSIGVAPPPGMPQPITMAILARASGDPSGCASPTTTAAR